MIKLPFALAIATCLHAQAGELTLPSFKEQTARSGKVEFQRRLKLLDQQYSAAQRRQAMTYTSQAEGIRDALLKSLETARSEATRGDRLSEAIKIRDAIKLVKEHRFSPPSTSVAENSAPPGAQAEIRRLRKMVAELKAPKPKLESALPNTNWRWQAANEQILLTFLADGKCAVRDANGVRPGTWRKISPAVVLVEFGSRYTLVFNSAGTAFQTYAGDKANVHNGGPGVLAR